MVGINGFGYVQYIGLGFVDLQVECYCDIGMYVVVVDQVFFVVVVDLQCDQVDLYQFGVVQYWDDQCIGEVYFGCGVYVVDDQGYVLVDFVVEGFEQVGQVEQCDQQYGYVDQEGGYGC